MQYGFYLNSTKCTGCKTCDISCKDGKDLAAGRQFRRIYECGNGEWEQKNGLWQNNSFAYYLSISCNHCSNPTCVHGCPTGAMHKREEDGIVLVNDEVCIGCRYCEMRCPYGAPQFDHHRKVMTKCDGCYERVHEGKNPFCVDSCPQRALEFDDIEVLRKKYGTLSQVGPLPDSNQTQPNLVIKPHATPASHLKAKVLNPEDISNA